MSDQLVSTSLPTFSEKISQWLGFKIPAISLPQTAKNLDRAIGRLISAGSENLVSRIERNTTVRDAKTHADIKVINTSGDFLTEKICVDSALAERAIEFSFSESLLKQRNREQVLKLAIEDLRDKTTAEATDADGDIDDDWLNQFSELISRKSQTEIQTLWARILSGKIRNPANFSLQSLQLLSSIDSNDANIIHKTLSQTINKQFIYRSATIKDLTEVITCESLGVLTGSSSTLNQNYYVKRLGIALSPPLPNPFFPPVMFQLAQSTILAQFSCETTVGIPCFILTRFGRDLCQLSNSFDRDEAYEAEFIAFLKSQKASLQRSINSAPMEDIA